MLEHNQFPFLMFAVLGATNISTPCLIIYMRKFLNLNACMYACVYNDWHDHPYKDSVFTIMCFDQICSFCVSYVLCCFCVWLSVHDKQKLDIHLSLIVSLPVCSSISQRLNPSYNKTTVSHPILIVILLQNNYCTIWVYYQVYTVLLFANTTLLTMLDQY